MRFLSVLVLLVLGVARVASAQSTIVVAWDYAAPPATVTTWTHAVLIDGTAQAGTPTCAAKAGAPTQTTCTMSMPMPAAGTHTAVVRATSGANVAELTVTGWNPAAGPTPGSGLRTTITITIAG